MCCRGATRASWLRSRTPLLELCRYVVLNRVRAAMVRAAEQWRWSSYLATVGRSAAPDWLQAQWVLSRFAADRETARVAYRRFVAEGMDVESPWQSLRGQIWLGGGEFRRRMSGLIAQRDLNAIPLEQTRRDRPTAALAHPAGAD